MSQGRYHLPGFLSFIVLLSVVSYGEAQGPGPGGVGQVQNKPVFEAIMCIAESALKVQCSQWLREPPIVTYVACLSLLPQIACHLKGYDAGEGELPGQLCDWICQEDRRPVLCGVACEIFFEEAPGPFGTPSREFLRRFCSRPASELREVIGNVCKGLLELSKAIR